MQFRMYRPAGIYLLFRLLSQTDYERRKGDDLHCTYTQTGFSKRSKATDILPMLVIQLLHNGLQTHTLNQGGNYIVFIGDEYIIFQTNGAYYLLV